MAGGPRTDRAGLARGGVTLQQVAAHAGVSLATASRALHGSPGRAMGVELRERVLAAAAELNYVPNAPAQALARSRTSVVGLIVHDVADPYVAGIAAGVMRAARERDLMVMLAATFRDPQLELDYLVRLRNQRARAVLLAGSGFADPAFAERLTALLADFTREGGRAAARALLEREPGLTALLVLNDGMAAGALAALQGELGLSVPGDVSVVGFDDLPAAVDLSPALTTVRLPLERMGTRALELILDESAPVRRIGLDVSLTVRASTGPVRGA